MIANGGERRAYNAGDVRHDRRRLAGNLTDMRPRMGAFSNRNTSGLIGAGAPAERLGSDHIFTGRRPANEFVAHLARRLLSPRELARLRLVFDLLVLYTAATVALLADPPVSSEPNNRWLALCFPIVVTVMMRARRSPDERLNASLLDTVAHVLGVVSLAAMLTVSADAIMGGTHPLGVATRLWLFALIYLGVGRAVLVSVRRQAIGNVNFATPTLIVGAGMIGAHLVKRLTSEPRYGLRPVAFLDADPLPAPAGAATSPLPVLGGVQDLSSALAITGARHVIVAFSGERDHALVTKVRECEALGVSVSLVPRLYESINDRTTLDHVGGLPLLTLHSTDPRGWQFAVKHALDRSLALAILLLTGPLLLALALAVRLSSPGQIFFRQLRVGRDGQEFTMLKFRSMRGSPGSDGEADAAWAANVLGGSKVSDITPAEQRVTRIGRLLRATSLDELPQLINVLRGEMSMVGPRPERVAYVRDFERHVERYNDRHRVKSGITGWAQVNGLRGQTSMADRIEWDNYYIQNWSLRLDLRILALTLAEVFRFRG
jgi:exopolysaccharide biosynthesis polyprenyl glycosylphosphotransferase